MPLKIGAVAYLNTLPLVEGLERGLGGTRIELSYAVPAELSDRMAAGELDVALLPIVELARLGELELVPGLGITTFGPSRSVLLVSRQPLERIESIALDPHSRTSNILAQLLLAEQFGIRPRCEVGPLELDQALDGVDAVVRIGDKALFEATPDGAIAHDLGTMWTSFTGLPFVFAAWVARPGVVDRELYVLLHDSRREGKKQVQRIADEFSWNDLRDPALALVYLTEHIRYRLGSAEIRAIERFFQLAGKHRLIDTVPTVRMALARRTACTEAAERRKVAP